jgi:hypothetical protein
VFVSSWRLSKSQLEFMVFIRLVYDGFCFRRWTVPQERSGLRGWKCDKKAWGRVIRDWRSFGVYKDGKRWLMIGKVGRCW